MLVTKPRVRQWVIFGDKCELGRIIAVKRQYKSPGKKAFGNVTAVAVSQMEMRVLTNKPYAIMKWISVNEIKVITPKEAKKLLSGEQKCVY